MRWSEFGVCVLLAWTAGVASRADAQGITLNMPEQQVGRYAKLELSLDVGREYQRPFDPCEVELNVRVTTPGGSMRTVCGS